MKHHSSKASICCFLPQCPGVVDRKMQLTRKLLQQLLLVVKFVSFIFMFYVYNSIDHYEISFSIKNILLNATCHHSYMSMSDIRMPTVKQNLISLLEHLISSLFSCVRGGEYLVFMQCYGSIVKFCFNLCLFQSKFDPFSSV